MQTGSNQQEIETTGHMKKMTKTIGFGVACVGLLWATSASAIIITSASVGGADVGAKHVNFDKLNSGDTGTLTGTGPDGSVSLQIDIKAQVLKGSIGGVAAAPYLSGNNGAGFESQSYPGADETSYLTSGKTPSGKITMTFGGPQDYLGMLWGSVDTYNTLQFFSGGTLGNLVGTVTGVNVNANVQGDQGINGTYYVNMYSTVDFDTVVVTSTQYAFEFDNVAYGNIPDGGTTLVLLGGALSGLAFFRRKLD